MHILIDVQGYQSESKFRGVGRSTYEMSRAIIKNASQHRVSILMNGMYSIDSVDEIKKNWGDILPQDEMFIFSAAGPTALRDPKNYARSVAAKQAREIAIANINPDIVFVINFYEGFDDNYTVSIPENATPWKTVCVCHDLIPLLNKEHYLGEPNFRQYYLDKLAEYERSDAIFAISESSMQEVIDYTKIPADKVINISSGVSDLFKIKDYTPDEIKLLHDKFHLPQDFILSLAMIESRKNIESLIHAYSLLPGHLQQSYPLVLAYKINIDEQERLYRIAENYGLSRKQLIFTGFLEDSDLIALYNLCKIFVFPSIHEGFGLPPLEAMRCGAATLGSNVTSLPEVIGMQEALFNPLDVQDICSIMQKALTDSEFYSALKYHAQKQAAKFTWDQTALLALEGFEKLMETVSISEPLDITDFTTNAIDQIKNITELSEVERLQTAWAIARNSFAKHSRKLLVDISVLVEHDAKTGIQRVSRSILGELLKSGVTGYTISAVYYRPGECYRYANEYLNTHFNGQFGPDEPVLFTKNDILVATDLTAHLFPELNAQLDFIRLAGATVCFVVHDILPLRKPDWSDEGMQRVFPIWLSCIAQHADRLICVSASVAEDVRAWITENSDWVKQNPLLQVSHFHLGADLDASVPSKGMPDNANELLTKMADEPSFIMVGTMEPRKGHAQTLAAFELLWQEGKNYNLFIIGKQGWHVDDLCERLRHHPQLNKKIFWLQNISDEFLEKLYAQSRALIFASLGEGFGLPLIEAAQKGLPVIIRDIPVFKEIAQDHAYYFSGEQAIDISKAIDEWLELYKKNAHPHAEEINWLTWKQSTQFLVDNLPVITFEANK